MTAWNPRLLPGPENAAGYQKRKTPTSARKNRTEMPYLQTAMSFAFACLGMAEWIFHLGNPATVLFLGTLAPLMTKEKETE